MVSVMKKEFLGCWVFFVTDNCAFSFWLFLDVKSPLSYAVFVISL